MVVTADRILVVRQSDLPLDIELLRTQLNLDVSVNSYPQGEGIALIDCGREVDWSWPSYVIQFGVCDVGRHNVDVTIPEGGDGTGTIIDIIGNMREATAEESEGEFAE